MARSKEFPNDVKKARKVEYDIFIPPYLLSYTATTLSQTSGTIVGPIFRKRWMEFVSQNLVNLFHKCGVAIFLVPHLQVIGNREKERMSKAEVYRLWDGRIESLLTVCGSSGLISRWTGRRCSSCRRRWCWSRDHLGLLNRSSKHPVGSMTSSERERNVYLAARYKERLEQMVGGKQVGLLKVFVGDRARRIVGE